jgi:hypothetical protein
VRQRVRHRQGAAATAAPKNAASHAPAFMSWMAAICCCAAAPCSSLRASTCREAGGSGGALDSEAARRRKRRASDSLPPGRHAAGQPRRLGAPGRVPRAARRCPRARAAWRAARRVPAASPAAPR